MCILLVEDEPHFRETVVDALADEDFETCEVATGDQAADLIEKPPKPLRLLMTDVDLPGKRDGLSLAQLMHRRHPSLPVLYMTARPDRIPSLGAKEALLAKPFSISNMIHAIRQLLTE